MKGKTIMVEHDIMDLVPNKFFSDSEQTFGLFDFLCGKELGRGSTRIVFDCRIDDSCVVKIEFGAYWQNILEFHTWSRCKDYAPLAKWLAPCKFISQNGRVMMQKKCEEIPIEKIPRMVPECFTDLKPSNMGLYQGRPVFLDYGLNLFMEKGMSTKLRKFLR